MLMMKGLLSCSRMVFSLMTEPTLFLRRTLDGDRVTLPWIFISLRIHDYSSFTALSIPCRNHPSLPGTKTCSHFGFCL